MVIPTIHHSPQNAGAFKCHHFPGWQCNRFSSLEVPRFTLLLFSENKFAKSADENVFTVLQGLLNQLEEGLDYLGRLGLGEKVLGKERIYNLGFGQSHWLLLCHFRTAAPYSPLNTSLSFE